VKEWRSRIVPRYQRRIPEVNEAVIATYLAGGNTRRIRGALQPLLKAAPLSKSAVSRVIATLKGGLEAWRTRSLTDLDVIYVYLDGFALRVRSGGKVVSIPVLGVVGVLVDGGKQLLALELCAGESFAAWNGCLEDLVARGLQAPVLAIIDGNAGLRRAVGLVWPKAAVQRCCVHKLRNLERKAPKHALADIRADFHRIGLRGECRHRPHRLRGFRAHLEQALSGRRNESARRRRRAPHVLSLPQNAVENATNHEHD
jgi:transposase-like protein